MTRKNKEMKSDDEISKTHKQNYFFNKMKNIKQINKKTHKKTPYSNKLWNQNKYELEIWTKPKFQQSLSLRFLNKLSQHFHSYQSVIQTSIGSNISLLTKDKPIKRMKNKVDQFLNKWKNRKKQ